MLNPVVSNPNDFKVVTFRNGTDFDFTPDMGCMYDSNPIFGMSGSVGIKAGESMVLPFHVGHRLAINLAKIALLKGASDKPQLDAQGQPIIKHIWSDEELNRVKDSYLTDLYAESSPIVQTETQRLMAKVEELRKLVEAGIQPGAQVKVAPEVPKSDVVVPPPAESGDKTADNANQQSESQKSIVYQDKAEVIAELQKRGIPFDARKNKENLEKLLA